MKDRVLVSGLDYLCSIGVSAEERARPQQILVDAEISVDIRRAAASQSADDSVDWEKLQAVFGELIRRRSWVLVETLIERLAEQLFESFPAASGATLRVKKYCLPNCAWVGVEIQRERPS